MSTYSNVATANLKTTATNAMKDLEKHNLSSIKDSLNTSILSTKVNKLAKNKLQDVISSTSINGSIAVLQKKLQNIISAADHIQNIQSYERQISSIRYNQITSLQDNDDNKEENDRKKAQAQNNIYYYQRLIADEEATISTLLS